MSTAPASPGVWMHLRRHTPARIGLERTGVSVATHDHLAFQLAHAQARDAVYDALNAAPLLEGLQSRGLRPLRLHSAAADRRAYLLRPDQGRRLDPASSTALPGMGNACDLAIVIADGLSARAAERHALPVLDILIPLLQQSHFTLSPTALVEYGRVAIGDEIGAALGVKMVVILIGERPGLSSPDSMGAYLTWAPRIGRKDAERNCISNIRPDGLGYAEAAAKLFYLLTIARERRLTGFMLKDDTVSGVAPASIGFDKFAHIGESGIDL
jgi:ethanolamine ammonia-lyase small subunit